MAASVLVDTASAWTRLTLVRGVSAWIWAGARLAALAVGGVGYLALLVAAMAVALVWGHPGPLVRSGTLWDVGLWALGLTSLGWLAFARFLTARRAWLAFLVPVLGLGLPRFGGNIVPYVPLAQWMAGLHQMPGTLSVSAGAAYLVGWTTLWGMVAIWRAKPYLSKDP